MTTKVKAWTFGDTAMPSFPHDFEIVRKAVLQVTDLKNNNNKYYALELHRARGRTARARSSVRLFTHYGRTDDLEKNPEAGQKECRFFAPDLAEAQRSYDAIYREKTSPRKGYEGAVGMASSKIGSDKARGSFRRRGGRQNAGPHPARRRPKPALRRSAGSAPALQGPGPLPLRRGDPRPDDVGVGQDHGQRHRDAARHPHPRPDREGRGDPVGACTEAVPEETRPGGDAGIVRRVLHGDPAPHRPDAVRHRQRRHRLAGPVRAEAGTAPAHEGHAPGQRRVGRRPLQRPRRSGIRGAEVPDRADRQGGPEIPRTRVRPRPEQPGQVPAASGSSNLFPGAARRQNGTPSRGRWPTSGCCSTAREFRTGLVFCRAASCCRRSW